MVVLSRGLTPHRLVVVFENLDGGQDWMGRVLESKMENHEWWSIVKHIST